MIYWLFQDYFSHHNRTLRMGMAAVLSFLIVLLLGPFTIRYLVRKNVSDSGTPTMGGVLIVMAIFVSVLLLANLQNMYIKMALLTVVWLGTLGGMDDWLKLRQGLRTGPARRAEGVGETDLPDRAVGAAVGLHVQVRRGIPCAQRGRREQLSRPQLLHSVYRRPPGPAAAVATRSSRR